MKSVQNLERLGNVVSYICVNLAAGALVIIVAINGLNVLGRYAFGYSWSWSEEAMLFLMILVVFSGSATAVWRGAHMRLEIFVDRISAPVQRAVTIFVRLFTVFILSVISVASFQVVSLFYRFSQRSNAIEMPMWIPQGFVFVGLVLLAFLTVIRLVILFTTPRLTALHGQPRDAQ